jgi:hypothetical protein
MVPLSIIAVYMLVVSPKGDIAVIPGWTSFDACQDEAKRIDDEYGWAKDDKYRCVVVR